MSVNLLSDGELGFLNVRDTLRTKRIIINGAELNEDILQQMFVSSNESTFPSINVSGTGDSNSVTTGVLQVAGGVGIAKSIHLGTDLILENSGVVNIKRTSSSGGIYFNSAVDGYSGDGSWLELYAKDSFAGCVVLGTRDCIYFRTSDGLNTFDRMKLLNNGIVQVLTTTDSNSITTGAFQVLGGCSITKNIYCGGNINASTAPVVGSHLCNKTYVDGHVTNLQSSITTNSNSIATNSNSITSLQNSVSSNTNSITTLQSSVSSNTSSLAALTTTVGEKQDIITAGTGLTKTGNTLSVNASQTQITSLGSLTSLTIAGTADSSSTSTGALQIAGGVGIGKSLRIGTDFILENSGTVNIKRVSLTGGIYLTGGVEGYGGGAWLELYGKNSFGGSLILGASDSILFRTSDTSNTYDQMKLLNNGTLQIFATTDSTSSSTGAVQISGGLGIAKNVHCAMNVRANNLWTGTNWSTSLQRPGLTMSVTENFKYFAKVGDLTTFIVKWTITSVSGTGSGQLQFYLPTSLANISRTYNTPEIYVEDNNISSLIYSVVVTATSPIGYLKVNGNDFSPAVGQSIYLKMTYM